MKRFAIALTIAALSLAACDKPAPPAEPATPEETKPVEAEPAPAEEEPKAADGHAHEGKQAAMPEDLKAGEQGFYGEKFTVIEPPIALAAALDLAKKAPGKAVKVEATVASVCKKKGCWFTMKDAGVEEDIRVRMKDYSFFVPKNADGARVVAEGLLASREIDEKEAQHYADDAAEAGEEPKKVDGAQTVWEFTATAIELKAADS
jgi:hypothetical protein